MNRFTIVAIQPHGMDGVCAMPEKGNPIPVGMFADRPVVGSIYEIIDGKCYLVKDEVQAPPTEDCPV